MERNANGLLQHHPKLQTVLDIEQNHICLISEIHFTMKPLLDLKVIKYAIHYILTTQPKVVVLSYHQEMSYETEMVHATSVNEIIVLADKTITQKRALFRLFE